MLALCAGERGRYISLVCLRDDFSCRGDNNEPAGGHKRLRVVGVGTAGHNIDNHRRTNLDARR